MIQQARKSWLLVEQSSCQPLTWTGKAIQVQQCWIQEPNEGLGSDELKDPSQLMLLWQEKLPVTAGHCKITMPVNLSSSQLPDTKVPVTYRNHESKLLEIMSIPTSGPDALALLVQEP